MDVSHWGPLEVEINKVELWQSATRLELAIRRLGVEKIVFSTDHDELVDAVSKLEKGVLGENFNKSLHTLPPNKFMWIRALDRDDQVVSIVAARLDDVGTWSLQRFIREHFARVINGLDGSPCKLTENSALFAKDIYGRCAYLGEGYAAPGWRRQGLATYMIKYMMLIVWDEWKPEIIYAWIRRHQIETGTAAAWGFTESYETPLEFIEPPLDPDWADTFFVGLRKIGVHQMIKTLRREAQKEALNDTSEDSIPPLF